MDVKPKNLYTRRRDAQLCPYCGGLRDDVGVIGCNTCNTKRRLLRLTHLPKYHGRYRKAVAKWARNKYKIRLERGICPVCGSNRDSVKKLCAKCRSRLNMRNKNRTIEKFLKERTNCSGRR